MTTRIYLSNDPSAPTLSGTVGSLIGILDACLINGYGDKDPAGWTKPFSGTNLAAYRQPVGTSNGMFLRIDDTLATYATVRGYEDMTAIGTGTGEFPLVGQAANVYWGKSSAASADARPWMIVTNDRGFYFWSAYSTDTTTYPSATLYYFAELSPLSPSDVWGTVLYGDSTTAPGSTHTSLTPSATLRSATAHAYRYAARPYGGGVGGSVGINFINYSEFYATAGGC